MCKQKNTRKYNRGFLGFSEKTTLWTASSLLKKNTNKYIVEAVFKYNHRNESSEDIFDRVL
jgi:hypothetical protein